MAQHRFLGSLLVLAAASACVVAACSTEAVPTPSGDAGTSDGSTSGTRITAAAGGTVADPSGRTSLVIPAGALAQDTDITLAILPKSQSAVVEISDFGPDGLKVLKPAALTIKGDATLAPSGKLALALDEGAGFKEIPGSTYANGAASGPITHFSKYSLVPAGGAPDLGEPAPGKTKTAATFSDAVNGYNGGTAAYTGEGFASFDDRIKGAWLVQNNVRQPTKSGRQPASLTVSPCLASHARISCSAIGAHETRSPTAPRSRNHSNRWR